MQAGTFWRRAIASLLDFLVLFPLSVIMVATLVYSAQVGLVVRLLLIPVGFLYQLYFLTLRGQTIGKKALKLKVVRVDGSPVTRKEVVLRLLVDLTFAVALGLQTVIFGFMAMGYKRQPNDFLEAVQFLNLGAESGLGKFISYLSLLYLIAQIICFFASSERRVIHDLIAGTRVIKVDDQGQPLTQSSDQASA